MIELKPVFVTARDINDCWYQLLYNLNKYGRRYKISSGSFAGHDRLAFDFISGFISNPHVTPMAPTMPEGSNLPLPTTDEKIQEYFSDYLMDTTLSKNEHYKYSSYIIGGNEVCPTRQLEWVIKHFKEHGYENEHCSIMIGDTKSSEVYDWPYKQCPKCKKYYIHTYNNCPMPTCNAAELIPDETKRGTSPCLRRLDFRIIDGYLTTHVSYRSWDCYNGFPTNMGGFVLLNQYIASELVSIAPGPLSFSCKSLHCYDFQLSILKMRVEK